MDAKEAGCKQEEEKKPHDFVHYGVKPYCVTPRADLAEQGKKSIDEVMMRKERKMQSIEFEHGRSGDP